MDFLGRKAWVKILAQPVTSCILVGKSYHHIDPIDPIDLVGDFSY